MAGTGGSISTPGVTIDTEIKKLCDVNGGVATPFFRHITYIDGVPQAPVDTELDLVTPYAVTGTIAECAEEDGVAPGQVVSHFQVLDENTPTWTPPAGLQSVTLVVLDAASSSRTVEITTADGTVAIDRGNVSFTWSVDGDRDPNLTGPSFEDTDPGSTPVAYVVWTTQ
jgi:hypothetical protein